MMRAVGPQVRRILCGVDGSEPACRAADHAAWLAHALGAELTFLAVAREGRGDAGIEAYRKAEGLGHASIPVLTELAESCLVAAQSRAATLGHTASHRLIRIGKVAPTLLSVADEIGADTVVLGRHDHGALHRSFVGSVSGTIAAKSRLNLLEIW